MAKIEVHKHPAIPSSWESNSINFVKNDYGFDLFVTDTEGNPIGIKPDIAGFGLSWNNTTDKLDWGKTYYDFLFPDYTAHFVIVPDDQVFYFGTFDPENIKAYAAIAVSDDPVEGHEVHIEYNSTGLGDIRALTINTNGIRIEDSVSSLGAVYAGDYEANFVDRSLVTKKFVLDTVGGGYVPASRTISAGNGLTGGGNLSANRTISLGTPSTLTGDTSNAVTTNSHTHRVEGFVAMDRRDTVRLPSDIVNGVNAEFNQNVNVGGSDNIWKGVLSVKAWTGTNYAVWQLIGSAHSGGQELEEWYLRSGQLSTWGSRRRIWHDGNFNPNDYVKTTDLSNETLTAVLQRSNIYGDVTGVSDNYAISIRPSIVGGWDRSFSVFHRNAADTGYLGTWFGAYGSSDTALQYAYFTIHENNPITQGRNCFGIRIYTDNTIQADGTLIVGQDVIAQSRLRGGAVASSNGTTVLADRYQSGNSLLNVGAKRGASAVYVAMGMTNKENDVGYVSTHTFNTERSLLEIGRGIDGLVWNFAPSQTTAVGELVTGITSYKVYHEGNLDLSVYLPKTGGTITGDLAVEGLFNSGGNYYIENDVIKIPNPKGGQISINGSNLVGAIKVRLPVLWTNTMVKFSIDVFNYKTNESFTVIVGGYVYNTSDTWANVSAQILGSLSAVDFTIRFGNDETNSCVWIGETDSSWAYLKVSVNNFIAGHSAYDDRWAEDWQISLATAFDTIKVTSNNNFLYGDYNKLKNIPDIIPTNRSIFAGNGMTGGGDLTANRTITLGTPSTITGSTTNNVTGSSHTHALSLVSGDITGALGFTPASNAISVTAGNGLSGGGTLSASRTLSLGTPGTITGSTSNAVTTNSHTHALTLVAGDIPNLPASKITSGTFDYARLPDGAIYGDNGNGVNISNASIPLDSFTKSGFFYGNDGGNDWGAPTIGAYSVLGMGVTSGGMGGYIAINVFGSQSSSGMWYKRRLSSGTPSWIQLWDSNNFNPRSQAAITSNTINMDYYSVYGSISSSTNFSLSNAGDGKKTDAIIKNTNGSSAVNVTISGVPFGQNQPNSIPSGGSAWISIGQINGDLRASIVIYS